VATAAVAGCHEAGLPLVLEPLVYPAPGRGRGRSRRSRPGSGRRRAGASGYVVGALARPLASRVPGMAAHPPDWYSRP